MPPGLLVIFTYYKYLCVRISERKFLVMGGNANQNGAVEYDVIEGEAIII
jgi:hypothetical protein